MKERLCDTSYVITQNSRDDFQCTDLETTVCQDKMATIMDVTCKDTFDFDCQKKKAADLGMEGYGMFTSCEKIPRRRCYVTCKDTFDFDCQKKKAAELGMEGYGMFTTCEKIPRRRCYETPRQVRTEVCQPDHSRFCQKVTNEHPEPA